MWPHAKANERCGYKECFIFTKLICSLDLYYEFHIIQRKKFIFYVSQYHQIQNTSGFQDNSNSDSFRTLDFKMTKIQNFKNFLSIPFIKIVSIVITIHPTHCCRMSTLPGSQLQFCYCLAQIS